MKDEIIKAIFDARFNKGMDYDGIVSFLHEKYGISKNEASDIFLSIDDDLEECLSIARGDKK